MDKRATITILVGLGIFAVGIIGFVIGGFGIAGIEESMEFTLEEVNNGTISIEDRDGYGELGVTFWVQGEYLDDDKNGIWDACETVTITVTETPEISERWDDNAQAHAGGFYSEVVFDYDGRESSDCSSDPFNKNLDRAEKGYVKIGRACLGCLAGDFRFESNTNVSVTYDDILIAEVGEDVGLIAVGFLGGSGALCCGIIVMLIGVILIFTLKDDAPVEMSVNADGTFSMDSTPDNTVGVGLSQSVSQITTSSVITEEMTKAEPYQFPSTESAPEIEEKTD